MSSGQTHDRLIKYAALSLPVAAYLVTEWNAPACLGMSAGIWVNYVVSPDMDLPNSNPVQRWQTLGLGWIWRPYRRMFGHRGNFFRRNFWTHCPVIGTFGRLWLVVAAVIAICFISPVPFAYSAFGLGLLVGLVIGDCVHLFGDVCQSYFGVFK